MPLEELAGVHFRVVCDVCRKLDAQVCCKRETGDAARAKAIDKLRRAGWFRYEWTDPPREKWFCPGCRAHPG